MSSSDVASTVVVPTISADLQTLLGLLGSTSLNFGPSISRVISANSTLEFTADEDKRLEVWNFLELPSAASQTAGYLSVNLESIRLSITRPKSGSIKAWFGIINSNCPLFSVTNTGRKSISSAHVDGIFKQFPGRQFAYVHSADVTKSLIEFSSASCPLGISSSAVGCLPGTYPGAVALYIELSDPKVQTLDLDWQGSFHCSGHGLVTGTATTGSS